MKFIPRAKRKALEAKLATLEASSDEAKAIRGQLGWGEPAPPAPKPVVKKAPAPPVPKPAVKKIPTPPAPKPAVKKAPTPPAPKKPAARKPIKPATKKTTKSKTT